jgi:hypothetical protein
MKGWREEGRGKREEGRVQKTNRGCGMERQEEERMKREDEKEERKEKERNLYVKGTSQLGKVAESI